MIELRVSREDLDSIKTRLEKIDPRRQDGVLHRAFKQASLKVADKLEMNVSGRILNRRTGHLAQSIGAKIEKDGADWVGTVGSGYGRYQRLPYAEIHETGGVITPKHAKYLTIPLKAALTPAGVPKRGSARDWQNTCVGKSKAGDLIIFQKTGAKGSRLIPLYGLKKSVTIPAGHYMSITLKEMEKYFVMAIRGSIERSLKNESE